MSGSTHCRTPATSPRRLLGSGHPSVRSLLVAGIQKSAHERNPAPWLSSDRKGYGNLGEYDWNGGGSGCFDFGPKARAVSR